jgi:hypothetical protein
MVMAFKDLYMSRVTKIPIVVPQAAHQALGMFFHVIFLRFTPLLFNYSLRLSMLHLYSSTAAYLGASTR